MSTLISFPLHIYLFALVLGLMLLTFVVFYLFPSRDVSRQLDRVNKYLRALNGKPDDGIDQIFKNSGVLEHLWSEYADTLHRQFDQSKPELKRFRSTVPAGVIFRPDILIDIPLRADFFKHLPGLFTGVGIIGTFYGLLIGLQSFVISENPVIVRNSLNHLLHGVSEAFLVSAIAITLAMCVTFIEKMIVTGLNAKAETLVQLLDGLFESGAGEEYLARLVKSSEDSTAQMAALLQGEFKPMLANFFEQQIVAGKAGSAALGDRIVEGIGQSLKGPLMDIAHSLQNVRNDQNEAAHAMLVKVLENFSVQMRDMFAGQVTGINTLQQQTIEALQVAVGTVDRIATDAGEAGRRSTEAISEQLAESLAASDARQRIMNDKLGEFIEQVRIASVQSQGQSQEKLQAVLGELSERMAEVIGGLNTQVRSAADASLKYQGEMAAQSQSVVEQMGGHVGSIVEGVNRAVAEMKSAVMAMRNTTSESMTRFNSGADVLHLAAKDFARAGQGVSYTLDKSVVVTGQLTQAANAIANASGVLEEMLGDYKTARNSMAEMMGALQALVEQAHREASMSDEVILRIEAATDKLVAAQKEVDGYLAGISDVLGEAHESFSAGMSQTVGEANREFHLALSDSVTLLREGIQELETTLNAANHHV